MSLSDSQILSLYVNLAYCSCNYFQIALESMRLPIQTKQQCQKWHFVLSLSFFFSQANSTLSYIPFGTGLHVNLRYFLACSAVISQLSCNSSCLPRVCQDAHKISLPVRRHLLTQSACTRLGNDDDLYKIQLII